MAQDGDTRGADQPEDGAKRRGPQAERDRNDEEGSVELRGSSAPAGNLEVIAFELADAEHAADDEANDEEQQQVCEQAVDAEHDEDGGIVAGEVAEIVVDSALHLAEVGRLGDALDVEELGDGPQIGEARRDRRRAQAVKAAGQVHAGRQGVDGNVEA